MHPYATALHCWGAAFPGEGMLLNEVSGEVDLDSGCAEHAFRQTLVDVPLLAVVLPGRLRIVRCRKRAPAGTLPCSEPKQECLMLPAFISEVFART